MKTFQQVDEDFDALRAELAALRELVECIHSTLHPQPDVPGEVAP